MTDKLPRFRYSTNDTHDEQIHALMMQVPAYAALQEQPTPKYGMFHLTFNNSKRRVKGYESHECMGVLYPEGNVHINTRAFHLREFESLSEMRDMLEEWGDVWIRFEGGAS